MATTERERLHIEPEARVAEDRALEAADRDRAAGRSTIIIAQTSNRHLDELNARAQAIRLQRGEMGKKGIEVPGRPYELHEGDHVQVRRTFNDPERGPVRNGTAAVVAEVDPRAEAVVLELRDGDRLVVEAEQIADADLRLAYVQHPFPAQGHTTDTAHVIIGDGVTAEGTYVGITRARERTDLYGEGVDELGGPERVEELAERVGRTEPEVPSIELPVARDLERRNERVWPDRQVSMRPSHKSAS